MRPKARAQEGLWAERDGLESGARRFVWWSFQVSLLTGQVQKHTPISTIPSNLSIMWPKLFFCPW